MKIGPHSHLCAHCEKRTECCGEIIENHDGVPPLVCVEYHDSNPDDFLCDDCYVKREHGVCEDCGAWYEEPHLPGCGLLSGGAA